MARSKFFYQFGQHQFQKPIGAFSAPSRAVLTPILAISSSDHPCLIIPISCGSRGPLSTFSASIDSFYSICAAGSVFGTLKSAVKAPYPAPRAVLASEGADWGFAGVYLLPLDLVGSRESSGLAAGITSAAYEIVERVLPRTATGALFREQSGSMGVFGSFKWSMRSGGCFHAIESRFSICFAGVRAIHTRPPRAREAVAAAEASGAPEAVTDTDPVQASASGAVTACAPVAASVAGAPAAAPVAGDTAFGVPPAASVAGAPSAPGLTLRPYQLDCLNTILSSLTTTRKPAVSLPTGSGKTVLFSSLIPRITPLRGQGNKTLVLVNRREIAQQTVKTIETLCPELSVGLELGDAYFDQSLDVCVASVSSISKPQRLEQFAPGEYKLVIVDEAHHAAAETYRNVLEWFGVGASGERERCERSDHRECSESRAKATETTTTSTDTDTPATVTLRATPRDAQMQTHGEHSKRRTSATASTDTPDAASTHTTAVTAPVASAAPTYGAPRDSTSGAPTAPGENAAVSTSQAALAAPHAAPEATASADAEDAAPASAPVAAPVAGAPSAAPVTSAVDSLGSSPSFAPALAPHSAALRSGLTPVLLGVSATLFRKDKKALTVFDRIVYHRDTTEMITSGHLCNVQLSQYDFTLPSSCTVKKDGSNFLFTRDGRDLVLRLWKQGNYKATVIFCINKRHVELLVRHFRKARVDARAILSDMQAAERRDKVDEFRNGDFPVLVNCMILTEGTDIPQIDQIIVATPLRSAGLAMQIIGRGLRAYPGKQLCNIVLFEPMINFNGNTDLTPRLEGRNVQVKVRRGTIGVGPSIEERNAHEAQKGLVNQFDEYTSDSLEDLFRNYPISVHAAVADGASLAWCRFNGTFYLFIPSLDDNENDARCKCMRIYKDNGKHKLTVMYNYRPSATEGEWGPTFVMASCDTLADAFAAASFRVRHHVSSTVMPLLSRTAHWRWTPPPRRLLDVFINLADDTHERNTIRRLNRGQLVDLIWLWKICPTQVTAERIKAMAETNWVGVTWEGDKNSGRTNTHTTKCLRDETN